MGIVDNELQRRQPALAKRLPYPGQSGLPARRYRTALVGTGIGQADALGAAIMVDLGDAPRQTWLGAGRRPNLPCLQLQAMAEMRGQPRA